MTDLTTPPDKQETTVPYSSDAFDVRRDLIAGRDETISVEYLETADAVTVVALTPDEELIMVEEWRQSVDRVAIGFPSGQLEPTDTNPADGARRELREETGYEPSRVVALQSFEPLNSLLDTTIHCYVAEDCRPTATPDPDPDEYLEVHTASLESVVASVRDGAISDMKTAVALLYYVFFEIGGEISNSQIEY